MTSDKPGNANASDATSPKPLPLGKLTESEFLARQAADALAAIKQTLNDMGATVLRTTDLPGRVDDHPIISLGAAATLGFLASSFIPLSTPAKLASLAAHLLRRVALAAVPLLQHAAAAAFTASTTTPAPESQPPDSPPYGSHNPTSQTTP